MIWNKNVTLELTVFHSTQLTVCNFNVKKHDLNVQSIFKNYYIKRAFRKKYMKAYVQGTMYGFFLPCTTNTPSGISNRN